MCSSWKDNAIWHANHSIKLNWGRVIEFLISAEMCTIVTSSVRQSRWCCCEVAPHSRANFYVEFVPHSTYVDWNGRVEPLIGRALCFRLYGTLFSLVVVGVITKLFQNENCTKSIPVYCSILRDISKKPVVLGLFNPERDVWCFNRTWPPLPLPVFRNWFAGLSGCWSTLSAQVLWGGAVLAAQQPPDLTALRVAAIAIAVCDADGGAEGIIY